MNAIAHSFIFWIALTMALLNLYILPSLIAIIRGTENLGWIIVLNLLPTGVGWLAALIMAVTLPRRDSVTALVLSSMPDARPYRDASELPRTGG